MGLKFAIMQMDLKFLKMLDHKNGSFVNSRVSSNHGQIEVPPPPPTVVDRYYTLSLGMIGGVSNNFLWAFLFVFIPIKDLAPTLTNLENWVTNFLLFHKSGFKMTGAVSFNCV